MSTVIHVVGAAILEGDRCLVTQRGPAMRAAGKWEFPGGKVEVGEAPEEALRREVAEELGLDIEVGALVGTGEAEDGGRRIRLDVYAARIVGGVLDLREHAGSEWLAESSLPGIDWADADVPIVPVVQRLLRGRS